MKTALITGASSGIGADAAGHLAAQGYRVILVARSEGKLDELAGELGENAVVEACDVSLGKQVLSLAERVRSSYGAPDVLVNCAGLGEWKRIEDTSPADALTMIRAPYIAAFNMTHAFMRDMLDRGSGVVIHVNSPASIFPWPSSVGYSAARWGLRGLHKALRQDLAGTGVRSCHVVFGAVDSPYFDHNQGTREKMPKIAKTIRTLSTDECGRLIAKLAKAPKREVLHPFMLKFYYWNYLVLPGVIMWVLRITGDKRT